MNEQRIITCSIVEDEPLALRLIENYVKKTPYLQLLHTYFDAESLIEDLTNGVIPELLFSDIQLPQMNGIELGKLLSKHTKVIFTTAYSKYAIEGFKVNALDYLLKPISYDDFLKATNKVLAWFKKEDKIQEADKLIKLHQQRPTLQVKTGKETILLQFDDIIRIEGLKDYIKIFCKDGSKHLALMRMKNILQLLPESDFERVHKSHIVNIGAITACGTNYIVINDQKIPISNQYGKKIKEKWTDFFENKEKQ